MGLLIDAQPTTSGTYVVALGDIKSPVRYDDTPWTQLQAEEAPAQTGGWAVLGTTVISPVDTDPSDPETRELEIRGATLPAGWYRLTFSDAAGAQQVQPPVFNAANITPTLEQVADLLATYLKDDVGEVATFTASTRPTADQVRRYIGHGLRRVRSKLGPIYRAAGDYAELADDATHAVALYAAAMAVLARTPEQQAGNDSHYANLKGLFDEAMTDLDKAAEEIGSGEEIGPTDDRAAAIGSFPDPDFYWDTEVF